MSEIQIPRPCARCGYRWRCTYECSHPPGPVGRALAGISFPVLACLVFGSAVAAYWALSFVARLVMEAWR